MNPDNAIELRDVTLAYYLDSDGNKKGLLKKGKTRIENRVLDGLNLDVKKGEILGIIGNNGAGKSTLLSIMAKILEPDSGTVNIDGKVAAILELGMGFHPDLSGRENIVLKGELYGFSKKQIESKIDEIIDYSGIGSYIDNPVRTYSSGMRSRLAFSIMIHVDAEIMLVDEILSTGDATFSAKASDYFRKILKDGKTVVYVSHSPGSVESLCTRVVWIDKGAIVADGRPKKVCALYHEASMDSLDVVLDQAKSGLSDAQYRLAMFYKQGVKVEQDEGLFRRWIELAANQGHVKAQVVFADVLIESDDEDDHSKAITYYQSAAARGDSSARNKLSMILGNESVRAEQNEIKKIFRYVAEKENPVDMFRYASFLMKTAWGESDWEEAFKWYKKVADLFNHPDAIIQLAIMYRDGIGTIKDPAKYVETLEKGHSLGIVKMTNMLADLYSTGLFVEENPELALHLYEECAEMGSIQCQFIVATMYAEGKGVEQNVEKAEYWFNEYSKTQLAPYQLVAIDILKNEDIPGVESTQHIYNQMLDSKFGKAQIELASHICDNAELYVNAEQLSSKLFDSLSKSYGKGSMLAYQHYSKIDSNEHDVKKTIDILRKNLYLGIPDQLFKYAMLSINNDSSLKDDPVVKKCIIVSARLGFQLAKRYCKDNNISYEI